MTTSMRNSIKLNATQSALLSAGCSKRRVTMTISLAFLSPDLVRAAVEGRLPRGIGFRNLTDPPIAWLRRHHMVGIEWPAPDGRGPT